MKRVLVALGTMRCCCPRTLLHAVSSIDHEFEQHGVDPDPLGAQPVDHEGRRVSDDLHRATIAFGLVFMRGRRAASTARRETIGELVYDVAQQQVAEQGLPHKADRPLVPLRGDADALHLTVNFLGFIPLPLTGETWHGFPVWGSTPRRARSRSRSRLGVLTFFSRTSRASAGTGPCATSRAGSRRPEAAASD